VIPIPAVLGPVAVVHHAVVVWARGALQELLGEVNGVVPKGVSPRDERGGPKGPRSSIAPGVLERWYLTVLERAGGEAGAGPTPVSAEISTHFLRIDMNHEHPGASLGPLVRPLSVMAP